MQARSVSAEESALVAKDVTARSQSAKREWPLKLLNILLFSMLLGSGVIVGVVICSYMTHYMDTKNILYYRPIYSPGNSSVTEKPVKLEQPIRPSANLLHDMADDELFWRASMVPQRKQHPFKRVPKIAFLFLTKGPLPLSPLWEKFFRGYQGLYSIYWHSLPSYKARLPPTSVFYRRQIPSQIFTHHVLSIHVFRPCWEFACNVPWCAIFFLAFLSECFRHRIQCICPKLMRFHTPHLNCLSLQVAEWGRISVCDAERRLLANALLDFSNDRFILLSETCIPVYNFSTVYNYLIKSQHSFVGAFDDPGPYGRGRYSKNMEPEVTLAQWRKGSQWFEVHRKLAVSIISDNIYYPKFKRFCTPACYSDEHYFPTMLSTRFGSLMANRSITWVDWSRGGSHPAMFGRGDITENLIKRIRNGRSCKYNNRPTSLCFLFARKFSPSALDPLLRLSSKLIGFGKLHIQN